MKKKIRTANQNTCSKPAGTVPSENPKVGPFQPPKNSSEARHATVNMLAYSAMKNMANFIELYSVWYPATSSVSASGRSKGVRLVSARPARKKITMPTNCGAAYGRKSPWRCTISERFSDRPMITTPSTLSAIDTSYETSCAQVRIVPRIENFDSDAQPPTMKP